MAADLEARATTRLTHWQDLLDTWQQALTAAHDELEKRVADPGAVPPANRRAQLGAAQHLEQATKDDATLRAQEASLRAELAAVDAPDAAAPLVDDLRANLVAQAAARVELRAATERAARAKAAVTRLAADVEATRTAVAAATRDVSAATERKDRLAALVAFLAEPPLDTLVADAGTALGGGELTAASDRVGQLLPATLVARSQRRYGEASQDLDFATGLAKIAATTTAGVASGDASAVLAAADGALLEAEARLRAYTSTAADRLAGTTAALGPLAQLPDLDAAVAASLDEGAPERADAVDAAELEQDLADAWSVWAPLDRAVTAARLAALAEDPDRDPGTVQAVQDAVAARDDAGVTGPLTAARAAYDVAAQTALDDWEAEVPPWLWTAAGQLHRARAVLARLADAGARAALVDDLDHALDAYAYAADAADLKARVATVVAAENARIGTEVDVLAATAEQRTSSFVRGDATGGRHDLER